MVQIKIRWLHSKIFIFGQKVVRMPIFGHEVFGYNSAIYGSIGLKIFKGANFLFVWRKMGVATTRAPLMTLDLQARPKIGWMTLFANRYLEIDNFFNLSRGEPPPFEAYI